MARARRTRTNDTTEVKDYRHDAKRKNNPPVGMVTYEPKVQEVRKQAYAYNPHLSPQLVWAGKVQMIYVDPPYGVKFSSNFQPRLDQRDVKDGDEHLTREPEQIKAYRDTWTLGVHSYLTYLRDYRRPIATALFSGRHEPFKAAFDFNRVS